VVGEWAWGLLGLCRFALGDDLAAADAFARAERLAPDDPSYRVRRRLAEARAS
jgi:cytochrome c-type biogenesis protein CcmH/NrfG